MHCHFTLCCVNLFFIIVTSSSIFSLYFNKRIALFCFKYVIFHKYYQKFNIMLFCIFSVVPKLIVCKFRVMHMTFEFIKHLSYSIQFELCGIPKISALFFSICYSHNRIHLFVIICWLINIYCKENFYEWIYIGAFWDLFHLYWSRYLKLYLSNQFLV